MAATALLAAPAPPASSGRPIIPNALIIDTLAPAAEHAAGLAQVVVEAVVTQNAAVADARLVAPAAAAAPPAGRPRLFRPLEMERGSSSSSCDSDGRSSPRILKQVNFSELLGPLKSFLNKKTSTNSSQPRGASDTPGLRNVITAASTTPTTTGESARLSVGLSSIPPAVVRPALPVRSLTTPVGPDGNTTCSLKEKYGKPCQLLGKGANGNCWLVRRHTDHKVFAVKEFRRKKETETQREYMKKLTNEYCIGTLLHHPNVVETLDIIFEKGHCYEVMELCEGGDLFEAIAAQSMTQDESNCIFAQLIHGVSYLHSTGVCHRDLKPENCLFDANNHLKIIDFGSADVVKSPFETQCRKSFGRCGSGPYMAPEEFTESSYDGRKVDVWACAIIYLAMMFQRFPWHAAMPSDTNYVQYVTSGCKTKFFDRLPEGPRTLLKRMLDPDPDKRYTIDQCLEDRWVKSILVHISHSTILERRRKREIGDDGHDAGDGSGVVSTAGGGVASGGRKRSASPPDPMAWAQSMTEIRGDTSSVMPAPEATGFMHPFLAHLFQYQSPPSLTFPTLPDMRHILASVASRPNPTINLGPIDMSSSFIVTSATDPDYPILYASRTFQNLTGYPAAEILGRNCRFLQAPDGNVQRGALRQYVDNTVVWQLKTSVDRQMECQFINVNYKKGGQPFVNLITIVPLCNANGKPEYFVGFQVDLMQQAGIQLRGAPDGSYVMDFPEPSTGGILARKAVRPCGGPNPGPAVTPGPDVTAGYLADFLNIAGTKLPDDPLLPACEEQDDGDTEDDDIDGAFSVPFMRLDNLESPDSTRGDDSPSPASTTSSTRENPYGDFPVSQITPAPAPEEVSYHDLVNASPDFVHILSSRGIILFASACPVLRETGWDPASLLGTNIVDHCHPADAMLLMREIKQSALRAPVSAAYRFRKRDRSGYVCLDVSGHKYELSNRKKTRCVVLTARERVWGSLKESALASAAPALPLPMGAAAASPPDHSSSSPSPSPPIMMPPAPALWCKVSATGLFVYVPPSSFPVFGSLTSLDALYGRSVLDFVYESDRARVSRALFAPGCGDPLGADGVRQVRCSIESAGRFVPASMTAHVAGGAETPFVFLSIALLSPPLRVDLTGAGRGGVAAAAAAEAASRWNGGIGDSEKPGINNSDSDVDVFGNAGAVGSVSVQCEINQLRLGNRRLQAEIDLLRTLPQAQP
ncbi:serine/threonine-protein kinase HAL4/sat4 [Geranomyces michiganensis]|nr:serine/threonine-protein kinase HAL4/sat4 [Geranomyces michiganensis]